MYRISGVSLVPNTRLKDRLAELQGLGLLDANMALTRTGYDFCSDYTTYVERFLLKYGLHPRA